MKKEEFRKCMDIIKGDNVKALIEYMEDKTITVSDCSLLMCYSADVGALNCLKTFSFFEGVNYGVYNNYPIRIAKSKGYHDIIEMIEPDEKKRKKIPEDANKELKKKLEEVRATYLLKLEILKDEVEEKLQKEIA